MAGRSKRDSKQAIRVIQLAWLKAVMRAKGESASALAEHAGISDNLLTRFTKPAYQGTLSPLSIDLIKKYTGLPGPEAMGSNRGFGIEEALPLDATRMAELPQNLAAAIKAALAKRPDATAYVLETRALEAAGYLRGDVVIVDTEATRHAGEPVCALVINARSGAEETIFRLYEPPYLVAASHDPDLRKPILVDNELVKVRGVITETFRARR